MKLYSRVIGDRDYSLFETVHFGLQLPGTLSSFGPVTSVSVSNWSSVKRGRSMQSAKSHDRVTYLSKLELFNQRQSLERPNYIQDKYLCDLSF